MSRFQVQDDIIRRALDYFGLRGVVPHEYENTVIPVCSVGDLGAKLLVATVFNIPQGNNIFLVPDGESWRVIGISGQFNQSAGTVAHRRSLSWVEVGTGRVMNLPFFPQSDTAGEVFSATGTLNTPLNFCHYPPKEFMVSTGWALRDVFIAGDGTRTMASCHIVYQRIGERMVDLV